jgi:TolB-like protein
MFRVKPSIFFLLVVSAVSLHAQTKPRLAILPFTGPVPEDAETLAEFFSFEEEINEVFTPLPRTRAIENLMKEQAFQRSGLTDSDAMAELGKQLSADYVLAGHITVLGTNNLLLIAVINVKELQQIAGDYQEYERIEDVINIFPAMAGRIADAVRNEVSGQPRLAVLPFNVLSSGMNQRDAELLAQLLATELVKSRAYAVYPRTSAIEKVMEEQHIERSGMTDPASIRAIGEAVNVEYVLSANVRKLGEDNYFSASILHVVEGIQREGARKKYQNVSDGLKIMQELAFDLTGIKSNNYVENETPAAAEGPTAEELQRLQAEKQKKKEERARKFRHFLIGNRNERFTSLGFSAATSFAAPWLIANLNITVPLFPYTFIEVGGEAGFIQSIGEDMGDYHSWYPYGRFNVFIPFSFISKNLSWGYYAGAGAGYMMAFYDFPDHSVNINTIALDGSTGIYVGAGHHFFRLSYALRTDFENINHQLLMGYSYRFY